MKHATNTPTEASATAEVQWHPTGKLAPPTVYLDEPTPNNCITEVDGNKRSFAFSFANFLDIRLKLCHIWIET